jgi:hypothetical protein
LFQAKKYFCPRPKNISAPKWRSNKIYTLMRDRHNVRIWHSGPAENPRINTYGTHCILATQQQGNV